MSISMKHNLGNIEKTFLAPRDHLHQPAIDSETITTMRAKSHRLLFSLVQCKDVFKNPFKNGTNK